MKSAERPGRFQYGRSEKNRVEAFSDGVLAIVITLLVLELRLPALASFSESALRGAIIHMLPEIWAWIVSFLFVLVFWVNHHYFFAGLRRTDRGLLWLNGLFLLAISFTPFPTGLVGNYPSSGTAAGMLSLAMFLTASAFSLMRWYVARSDGLSDLPRPVRQRAFRAGLVGPFAYALAMALSLLWTPGALLIQTVVPMIFFLRAPIGAGEEGGER
ncbi:MAG: TMEM175 family protein [Steroidobacteraceae bacterium]